MRYWSRLPFPTPGDLPDPGIKPRNLLRSPALATLSLAPPEKPQFFRVCVSRPIVFQLSATPWTVSCQTLLSMGFSRQEYWSGLHFVSQGIFLTDPGIYYFDAEKESGRQSISNVYTYTHNMLVVFFSFFREHII